MRIMLNWKNYPILCFIKEAVFIHRADNHESPNRCHSLKGYGANIYKELSNLKKPNGINIYSNKQTLFITF
jgi:hypothetical protein